MGENTRLLYDLINHTEQKEIPGLLLLIDFEKAFDSLSWSFIRKALKFLNFGESFRRWIDVFYKGISSAVIQCGHLSSWFQIGRGCRQGDPLSPYIFIICAEFLSTKLRKNKNIKGIKIELKEFKISQFTDDTTVILDGSDDSMGTNCAPLVADLFLFCYERDFMMSLSDDKQADVIDAFNTTSRYLDDILNINNVYFDNMVSQIYPSELQLNKANASDTEAAFLDLHLSISNDIVSTKIYDKHDDFDFEIVNFPFLDGDVPRSTSYGVYISQLIRFAKASSYVADFNTRNKLLTQKLLKQGYRYHKLRKTFSKFYRRYYDLISKFQVGLKSLLRQGLSEPDFYGDLVYKLKKIVDSNNFSAQFIKIISHYKKIGYNINVLQQTACLVVNPITVGNFAFLFNCTPVGRTSDSMMVPT